MNADLEIIGLESNTNCRSCTVHSVCGQAIAVGDVLRLVGCVVQIDNITEDAIKCVKVIDGVDTCTVAFVPRVIARTRHVSQHLNKFIQVVKLYKDSPNSYKRSKLHQNKGIAACAFLDDNIGRDEQDTKNIGQLVIKSNIEFLN